MQEQKHSGLGIASFMTSVASGGLLLLVFLIAGVMEASTPGGIDEESPGAIVLGGLLVAFLGAAVVALGLGVSGLFQKDRMKVFAVLGTVLSLFVLLVTTALLALGWSMD